MDWNPQNAVAAVTGRWCGIARFGFRSAILVLFLGAFGMLNQSDALADEFEVAIVISPTADGTDGSDFLNGFQLAVDQSPDVSHPPNTEGGDHLGSMDVEFVVIDDLSDPVESASVVANLEGFPIIVADVTPEVLGAMLEPLKDANAFVIATRGVSDPGESPLIVEMNHRDTDVLLTDRPPGFAEAYAAAHGDLPSEAATRGYITGRMIDIAVEATDRDPFDTASLSRGINDVVGQREVSDTGTPPGTVLSGSETADTPSTSPERDVTAFLAWVIVSVIVIAVGIMLSRRFRPTTDS